MKYRKAGTMKEEFGGGDRSYDTSLHYNNLNNNNNNI